MFNPKSLTRISAALVVAVWGSIATAATTTDCPGAAADGRDFTLTTESPVTNTCYAWGDNNDTNDIAFQAQIDANVAPAPVPAAGLLL